MKADGLKPVRSQVHSSIFLFVNIVRRGGPFNDSLKNLDSLIEKICRLTAKCVQKSGKLQSYVKEKFLHHKFSKADICKCSKHDDKLRGKIGKK